MQTSIKNQSLIQAYNKGYRVSKCGRFIEYKNKKLYQKYFANGYPELSIRVDKKVRKVK